jgi:hypothetical protein
VTDADQNRPQAPNAAGRAFTAVCVLATALITATCASRQTALGRWLEQTEIVSWNERGQVTLGSFAVISVVAIACSGALVLGFWRLAVRLRLISAG